MHTMQPPRPPRRLNPHQPSSMNDPIPNAWTAMIARRWTTLWMPKLARTHRDQVGVLSQTHELRLVHCLRLGLDERTIAKHSLDDPTAITFDCVLQRVLERKSRGNGGRRDMIPATTHAKPTKRGSR